MSNGEDARGARARADRACDKKWADARRTMAASCMCDKEELLTGCPAKDSRVTRNSKREALTKAWT